MKKFRKILVLLLIVILASVMNVYAANSKITLNPSATEVKVGDTYTVGINVQCDTNFEGLTGKLEYDKTKLELVSKTDGEAISDMNANDAEGNYVVTLFLNSATTIKSATCQTITFKVLDTAKVGDQLGIKLTADLKDGDAKVENLTAQTTIKIVNQNTETTKDENNETKPTEDNKPTTPTEDNNQTKPAEDNKPTTTPTQENKTEIKTENKTTNTQSNTKVPYTGIKDNISLVLISLIVLSAVSYIGYKKYKNI